MVLTSRIRQQGESMITTIPAEVARRLALQPGHELFWRARAPGAYTVTALDPERAAALDAHERIIEPYREVVAALANERVGPTRARSTALAESIRQHV
jgi:antitoxin component of MazEF toxin-antitoxin module